MNVGECAVNYNKATMDTRQFPPSSSSSSGPSATGLAARREFPAAFRGGQGARAARGGAAEPYTRRYYEEQRRNAEQAAARAAAAEADSIAKSREMNETNFPVLSSPPVSGGTHRVWEHRATDLAAAWSEADMAEKAREQAKIEAARSERHQFSGTQFLAPTSSVNRMPARTRHKYSGAGAGETYEEETFAPPAPAPTLSPDEMGWTVVDSRKKGPKRSWKTTAAEEEQDTSTWDQGPQTTEEGDESVW